MGGDDLRATLGAARLAVVTADEVWAALAEIPDPEIPVISLVDLGVVKNVAVEDGTVRVDFTPTFMGCPALEVMQRAMESKIAALGGSPGGHASGSTTRGRPTTSRRRAARSSARPGFAPPAPRPAGKLELTQLQRGFRCPYCGSTSTKLENLFGPTPVSLDPLLRRLPPAVRAVQDDLTRVSGVTAEIFYCPT